MADIERLTIALPTDKAASIKEQLQELEALKADIDKGLADVAAGRVKKFDAAKIIARGRKLLADRLTSV